MDERDKELDDLLAPLASLQPSELETQRWVRALEREKNIFAPPPRVLFRKWVSQLSAAVAVGFLLGILSMRLIGQSAARSEDRSSAMTAMAPSATIESVYAKSE